MLSPPAFLFPLLLKAQCFESTTSITDSPSNSLTSLIRTSTDSEAAYRALVALGTLLTLGDEVKMAANDIFDAEGALKKAESTVKEPRIKGVVAEIRASLGSVKGV